MWKDADSHRLYYYFWRPSLIVDCICVGEVEKRLTYLESRSYSNRDDPAINLVVCFCVIWGSSICMEVPYQRYFRKKTRSVKFDAWQDLVKHFTDHDYYWIKTRNPPPPPPPPPSCRVKVRFTVLSQKYMKETRIYPLTWQDDFHHAFLSSLIKTLKSCMETNVYSIWYYNIEFYALWCGFRPQKYFHWWEDNYVIFCVWSEMSGTKRFIKKVMTRRAKCRMFFAISFDILLRINPKRNVKHYSKKNR